MSATPQLDLLQNRGWVRLPGALATREVDDMRERLWSLLERNGASREDPASWRTEHTSHLQALREHDPAPCENQAVSTMLDSVFGEGGWKAKADWGQVLVTFPTAPPWHVPNALWHLDHPYHQRGSDVLGINAFLFVDDVEPRGGGTVAVESSPELVARFVAQVPDIAAAKHGALNRRLMAWHPWLARLLDSSGEPERTQRFLEGSKVDDLELRVAELAGRVGDVVLCHPWLIHAPAPNVLQRPRMMRALRVYRRTG